MEWLKERLQGKEQLAKRNRPQAFLYTQAGVNDNLTLAAREELTRRGIRFQEIDLTGVDIDEEWPGSPVISSLMGFIGGFQSREDIQAVVSNIR